MGWGREGVRESGRLTRCKPLLSRCEHLRHKESRPAQAAPVGRLAWCQSRSKWPSSLLRSCTLSQLGQRCSWRCSRRLQTASKKPTLFSCRGSFPPSWTCEARSRALDRGEDPTRSRTLPTPPPLSCHRRRAMGSPSSNRAWKLEFILVSSSKVPGGQKALHGVQAALGELHVGRSQAQAALLRHQVLSLWTSWARHSCVVRGSKAMCHLKSTSQTTKAKRGQNVFKATSCVKVRAATLSDTGRPFLEERTF